ncbi:hypothetical protein RZS08_59320, partial [Arthrospira platensis SPKY1]|nr:hypothetical protein [Arthrospira platensis SPKY1]
MNGSINFFAGENGWLMGNITALRSEGSATRSDIRIFGAKTLTVGGNITADHVIELSAGTHVDEGTVSLTALGTVRMTSVGGDGQILLYGVNDVVLNSSIGTNSTDLQL